VEKLAFLKTGVKQWRDERATPEAQQSTTLTPLREICEQCGNRLWVAYHSRRKVMTLETLWQLTVVICHCPTPTCPRYHVRYHPEEEGRWALPHGEFGLDVIAIIGAWRFGEHRSVPEMHQRGPRPWAFHL